MDLPMHPLVVHAATVLLPLSLVGVVLAVLLPRLRPRLAGLSVLGLAAAAVAAWIAEESGESLADRVGVAQDHARYGEILPVLAVAALVVAAAWWRLQGGPPVAGAPDWAARAAGAGVVVTAAVTMAVTVLAGHSGAVSVWQSRSPAASPAAATGPAPGTRTAEPGTEATPTGPAASPATVGYTLAEVAEHSSRTDCWSAVDGAVYDLTAWISQHPGGPGTIAGMCGLDASAAFRGKHGTAAGPANALTGYRKGPLTAEPGGGTAPPAPATNTAAAAPTTRYSRAAIAKHGSADDCWSHLDGKVYDLTRWVSQHPGGAEGILEMCGTSGGEFLEQHAQDKAAREVLAGFQVGLVAT